MPTPSTRSLAPALAAASLLLALSVAAPVSAQDTKMSVSRAGGPVGAEVTVKMSALPPGRALDVGFGGLGSNYELLGSVVTDLEGSFSAAVKVPTWAQPNRSYFFFFSYTDQPPSSFSDPFIVTAGDGSFRVTGNVTSVATGCAFLTSQTLDKAVYTLVGPISQLSAGTKVAVDGTLAPSDALGAEDSPCRRGAAIPVQVRSVSIP